MTVTRRWPLPEAIPLRAPHSPRIGEGPRVLLVADERDLAVRAHLRTTTPHLAEAGYRLSFVPASRGSLISAVGERLRARSYALVHVHGPWLAPVACVAGLVSSGPPLLVSLREPPGTAGVRRWLLGRALARAAAVVTACDDDRATLLRRFPNLRPQQERVVTITDGVGASLERTERAEAHTVIGCVISSERGRDVLLGAVARLVRFGNVPAFRVEAYAPEVTHSPLRESIESRGVASVVSVRPLSSDCAPQADLFVALSRADAQPAMQALCAGVPLIAPDCPGLREILDGSPARVCVPNEVTSLETALREALSEPREEEAHAYAPTACERFDAGRAAGRLVELYDRLTSSESAKAA